MKYISMQKSALYITTITSSQTSTKARNQSSETSFTFTSKRVKQNNRGRKLLQEKTPCTWG